MLLDEFNELRKWALFQSSSSPKAGCYRNFIRTKVIRTCFNPHPARRLDAMICKEIIWWVINLFQSSSSPKAGCYTTGYVKSVVAASGFNPHPARRLDAISKIECIYSYTDVSILIQPEGWMLSDREGYVDRTFSFNPHPARRLDAIAYT